MPTYRKLPSGRVNVQVLLGKTEDGRRRFDSETFDTLPQARAWAQKREVEKAEGTLRPTLSKKTFADYIRDVWLPDYRTQVRSVYTVEKTLTKWIARPPAGVPLLGKKPTAQARRRRLRQVVSRTR
jgi:hypothetical protein